MGVRERVHETLTKQEAVTSLRPWYSTVGPVAMAGATGAALMYWLDPNQGRRRRALARDRVAATARRGGRRVARLWRRTTANAYGLTQKMTHHEGEDTLVANDATLAQRVQSELFRDPAVPKGRLNINAEEGIVVLRGEVARPDQIEALEAKVRRIPGVRDVENFLHLPHTPSPNKLDALEAGGAG